MKNLNLFRFTHFYTIKINIILLLIFFNNLQFSLAGVSHLMPLAGDLLLDSVQYQQMGSALLLMKQTAKEEPVLASFVFSLQHQGGLALTRLIRMPNGEYVVSFLKIGDNIPTLEKRRYLDIQVADKIRHIWLQGLLATRTAAADRMPCDALSSLFAAKNFENNRFFFGKVPYDCETGSVPDLMSRIADTLKMYAVSEKEYADGLLKILKDEINESPMGQP